MLADALCGAAVAMLMVGVHQPAIREVNTMQISGTFPGAYDGTGGKKCPPKGGGKKGGKK